MISKGKNQLRLLAAATAAVFLSGVHAAPNTLVDAAPLAKAQPTLSTSNLATDRYIVHLADAPLARYQGGTRGIAAPSRDAARGGKLDTRSPQAQQYVSYLRQQQADFLSRASVALGRPVNPLLSFQYGVNGLSLKLTGDEVNKIRDLPGVALVDRVMLTELNTDAGPAWIGAPTIWDGSNVFGGVGTFGEGVVLGILDSGINQDHPSFAEVGPIDGFVHTNPLGSGNFTGDCVAGNPGFDPANVCNNKLIGGYDFIWDLLDADQNGIEDDPDTDDDPTFEDGDGHGSHTASTAGGNQVAAASFGGVEISGVARHANVIAFDVCFTEISTGRGLCASDASVASVDAAIADGLVDVINYSISGGTQPWDDSVSLAFLSAVDAGIFVSASAGNSGPGAATLGHVEPWTMSVAAGTHDRASFANLLDVDGGPQDLAARPAGSGGIAMPGPLTDEAILVSPILDACTASGVIPPATFAGGFAVVQRGGCPFSEKINNVAAAGAEFAIIFNNTAGLINANATGGTIPSLYLTQAEGNAVVAFLGAAAGTADYDDTLTPIPGQGDVVAGFSSRGPSAFESNKPDIIGPGVSILAAFAGDPTEFGSISGTSMSSPHNAGSAALLRALFPGWTPQEIKSALMLTSKNTGLTKEDGVTPADPFDVGAGRMDLNFAAKTGLVMHETTLKFFQADPTAGGDPKTLNIASVKSDQCVGTCSWTRRFRSVAADPVTYDATMDLPAGVTGSVTPANFTVNPGQTVTLTIEVDVSGATPETWNFGEVVLTPQGAGATPGSDTFTTAAAPVAIPDNQYPPGGAFNAPTMACQTVDASSLPPSATITDVSIQAAMAHTWVGDTVAKLGSPDGTVMGVFSRPGMAEASDGAETGFGDSSNLLATSPITFEDSGGAGDAENMGNGGTLGDAGVVCQDDARCNFFANRGGIAVGPTNFAGFDGEAASGIWTFCMGDGAGGDTGTLTSWTLNIDYETSAPSIYSTLHLPVVAFGVADEPDVMLPQGSLAIPTDAATTGDADLTIANVGFSDLDWTLDEELAPAAAFGTTTLSQSTSESLLTGNSVACNAGGLHADNSYWRAFALNDFGITGSFDVSSVRVGVEQATSTNLDQPVTVNLYTLNGAFVIANLTPIGTATVNLAPQTGTLVDVPVTGTVPASGTLVVEVFTPDGQTLGNGFFIGSNADGQSAPSFISAATCGITEPTDTAAIGFADMHIVLTATGTPGGGTGPCTTLGDVTWISANPTAGTTAAGGQSISVVSVDPTVARSSGDFATNLCLGSNDPDEPLIVIPVLMQVSDLIFRENQDDNLLDPIP